MDARLQAQVWRRAQDRCEYCQFPAHANRVPFQMDHIIAEKHGGPTALENLALSCFFYDTYKGPNLSGLDPQGGALTRLFHPQQDRWSEHFRWNGSRLVGLPAAGRTTIAVLRMNRDDAVTVRQALLEEGAL